MQDNNFQDDLFGKSGSARKPPRIPVLDGYGKQRYLPFLKMPTEYAVMAVIVVLILLTVAYALGVKVGRDSSYVAGVFPEEGVDIKNIEIEPGSRSLDQGISEFTVVETVSSAEQHYAAMPESPVEDPRQDAELSDIPQREDPVESLPVDALEKKGAYRIYLAAFREESKAKALSEKLTVSGIDANVSKSSGWHQVYAEGYSAISEANSAKEVLRKDFPDCYIRKIE
ncbi:MAG: SPOR domain-containing protein [Candidatus Omnitrophota bacterium]